MTQPDFRALCAELVDELNYHADEHSVDELMQRARTALATPPPEPPTDEEILKAVRHLYGDQTSADTGAENDLLTARAVLEGLDK